MKAVILAAGIGTRLKHLTKDMPKVMIEFVDKPLLEYIVSILKENGIEEIVVIVGYKKEAIMNYFGDGSRFGVKIEYVEQKNYKGGTADAINCARSKITENKFLVVYGDNFFESEVIGELIKKSKNYDGVICCKMVDNPSIFGVLKVKNDKLIEIIEKPKSPPSNLVFAGIFVLPKEIFKAIDETKKSPRGELEITDSINKLISKGSTFGYFQIKGFWKDIGDENDLEKVKEHVNNNC